MPRPPNENIVRFMWLFKHKYFADGSLSMYKARLVANEISQQIRRDCDETSSLVVKPATIRTLLSLAASQHWHVHQLDVNNSFLYGSLSETVYMHQHLGFQDLQRPDHVCLLQRSLYGLKLAPRASFQRFKKKYASEILERAGMHNGHSCMTHVDMEFKLVADGNPVSNLTLYRILAGALQYPPLLDLICPIRQNDHAAFCMFRSVLSDIFTKILFTYGALRCIILDVVWDQF
ncbi:ribonuclease H-like domain-containing protein [Tanacetum coccineum]